MQEYPNKAALIAEIGRAAEKFIAEFADIAEADRNLRKRPTSRTYPQSGRSVILL